MTSHVLLVEVSDCYILRHHDPRIMTYHDCENYHDFHILQIIGTKLNKLLCIKFIAINTCHCTILMVADVMESHSTHYKCYWNTFKQGNT